jgi:hypothetical protein
MKKSFLEEQILAEAKKPQKGLNIFAAVVYSIGVYFICGYVGNLLFGGWGIALGILIGWAGMTVQARLAK